MLSLKEKLIKIGSRRPSLRSHLEPIIARIDDESRSPKNDFKYDIERGPMDEQWIIETDEYGTVSARELSNNDYIVDFDQEGADEIIVEYEHEDFFTFEFGKKAELAKEIAHYLHHLSQQEYGSNF
jgi:hypothetical protein